MSVFDLKVKDEKYFTYSGPLSLNVLTSQDLDVALGWIDMSTGLFATYTEDGQKYNLLMSLWFDTDRQRWVVNYLDVQQYGTAYESVIIPSHVKRALSADITRIVNDQWWENLSNREKMDIRLKDALYTLNNLQKYKARDQERVEHWNRLMAETQQEINNIKLGIQ